MPARKMHIDEVNIDVSLVGRLVAEQFPQWADLPIEPVPSTGTVNAIYLVGGEMCARLPRVHRWAAHLAKELRWLPELAPHLPLAVPEPLAEGRPGEDYPFPWAVYRWIEGEPFTSEGIGDPGRAAVDLARFVAALRRLDPVGAPPSSRGSSLATRDARTRVAIESLRGVVDTDEATAAWEASLRAPAWGGDPVWIHGDLLPPNLLVDDGRLRAVIDFGGAGLGDPACDVLPAWSVLSDGPRDAFRSTLEVDEATWVRARGWALSVALLIIPYYADTNPQFVALATRMVDEVLHDHARTP